jgi:DegV family protein with EDD domain
MTTLDGFQLYGFFSAGSHRVHAARHHIDSINVFPVPDGDTGTNLSSTLSGALASTIPGASAALTLTRLADAAILSARGNSGVIFAQFITGLSESVRSTELRTHEFIEAVHHAYRRAKEAVTDPKEGTILSVIETWALSLSRKSQSTSSITELIGATREDLQRSLAETTEKLLELKNAGVVDAGAAGFIEFVEGGHDFLLNGASSYVQDTVENFEDHAEAAPTQAPGYRYCVEAIVAGDSIHAENVRQILLQSGDCLIVAGGKSRIKIHIHTDKPDEIMEKLSVFGMVTGQKADDMMLQFLDAHDRKAKTAIVTDSSCDLSQELLEKFRIHVVPLYILAQGSEYLDKLTIDSSRLRNLSEGTGTFPKTSQASAAAFSRLYMNLTSHYESAIAIHLSSSMSGTLAASRKEAEKLGNTVAVFDSKHLSGSLGLIVLRAAEAAEEGHSREEIMEKLPEWSKKARILVSVTSLKYMVKGGRVSPLKGKLAQILNLKPIVSVDGNGKSILYGKAFSEKANLDTMIKMVGEDHAKTPLRWYAVGHAGVPEKALSFAARLERKLGFKPLYITEISSVVALNSGPGAISVVTMAE